MLQTLLVGTIVTVAAAYAVWAAGAGIDAAGPGEKAGGLGPHARPASMDCTGDQRHRANCG